MLSGQSVKNCLRTRIAQKLQISLSADRSSEGDPGCDDCDPEAPLAEPESAPGHVLEPVEGGREEVVVGLPPGRRRPRHGGGRVVCVAVHVNVPTRINIQPHYGTYVY